MKAFQASFNNIFRYEIHLLTRILNTNLHPPHKNFLFIFLLHSRFLFQERCEEEISFRYFFFCISVYTVVIDFVILQLSFVFYLKNN